MTKTKNSSNQIFILPKLNFSKLINCFYETSLIPEFRFGRYHIDFYSEELKLGFEYDGIHHYSVIQKITSDLEKEKLLLKEGIRTIRWPFYLMPTRDVTSYIFAEKFTEKKFQHMLASIFNTDNESDMASPGFHNTTNIPGNFIEAGINKFLNEINRYPDSLKDQVRHSLKLYCLKKKMLGINAIPYHNKKFMEFYEKECNTENLNMFFVNQ